MNVCKVKGRFFTIVAATVLLLVSSCGAPKNDPVAKGQLQLPEILSTPSNATTSENSVAQLLSQHDPAIFMGNFLLWRSDAKGEKMGLVASSTASSRTAKAAVLSHQENLRQIEKLLAEEKRWLATPKEELATSPELAESLRQGLSGWVEQTLQELQDQGQLSENQTSQFLGKFNQYCEYKLWELAVAEFADEGSVGPILPAVSCQNHYENLGLAACDQADSQQKCLWKHGVLNSARFQQSADQLCRGQAELSRRQAVEGWLEGNDLQHALTSELKASEYTDELLRVKVRQAVIGGRPLLTSITRHFSELANCKDAFLYDDMQTFNDARLMFENQAYSSLLGLETNEEQEQIIEELLLKPIRALEARQQGEDLDEDLKVSLLSVADRLVNLISLPAEQSHTNQESEAFVKSWLAERHLVQGSNTDGSAQKDLAVHLKHIEELEAKRLQAQARLADARKAMMAALNVQLSAALHQQTVVAFWPLNIAIARDQKTDALSAWLTGQQAGGVEVELSRQHQRGFTLTISNLAAQPMAFVPTAFTATKEGAGVHTDRFNNLKEIPQGAQLSMDLYLQNVGGSLPLLSGKVTLSEEGKVLAHGAVGIDLFNALNGI